MMATTYFHDYMRSHLKQHVISAAIAVGFVAPVTWMLMDRTPPFELLLGRVIPSEVAPGSEMTIEWTVKTNRVCPGYVERRVILADKSVITYDWTPAIRREDISNERLIRSFVLSRRASDVPGSAHYRSRTCYTCNPLQHWWPICSDTPELPFTVLRDGSR
jgi:hypothetical protein